MRTLACVCAIGLVLGVLSCSAAPSPAAAAEGKEVVIAATMETLVRVRVIARETGEPVAGVRLGLERDWRGSATERGVVIRNIESVDGPRATPPQIPRSDAKGVCEFVVEPGYRYSTELPYSDLKIGSGRPIEIAALAPGELREVELHVATLDDIEFHGRVIDVESREPIAGARVRAHGAQGEVETTTDKLGRFAVAAASWSSAKARVAAEGYASTVLDLDRVHARADAPRDIALSRSAELVVELRLPQGAGRCDVRLATDAWRLRSRSSDADGETLWSVNAGANGRAVFKDLPSLTPLTIEVSERGGGRAWRQDETLVLAPGERRKLAIELATGATVRGRLVDGEQRPIAEHAVVLTRASGHPGRFLQHFFDEHARCTTDEDGRFDFGDVAPGEWLVGPAPDDWFRAPETPSDVPAFAEAVHVARDGADIELVLVRPRGLYIAGRVLTPDRCPATEGWVSVESDSAWLSAAVDQLGRFRTGPLMPGEWTLSARAFAKFVAPSLPARANAGDNGVELVLREGGVLEVATKSPSSRWNETGFVWLQRAGEDGALTQTFLFGGRAALVGLEPGDYSVAVQTDTGEWGAVDRVEVRAGAPAVVCEVAVTPGALLALSSNPSAPAVAIEVLSTRMRVAFAVCRGRCEVNVPAGRITLVTRPRKPNETRVDLELAPGERRELALTD